jgi:predicted amidohydrolase YtcJ
MNYVLKINIMCDLIFHNGNIFSFKKKMQSFEAIAVKDGKIVAIGKKKSIFSLKTKNTQFVDLQGNTLLPGFIDAHIHVWKVGNLMTYTLDLRGVKSITEIQQKLLQFRNENPEATWINARGFNEITMEEGRLLTKSDLDMVISDIPVIVQRTCAHITVVNSQTLKINNISSKTKNPNGGKIDIDSEGKTTGILRETAQGLAHHALPKYTQEAYEKMILSAQSALISQGITTATDPAITPDLFAAYQSLSEKGALKMRIRAFPILLPDGGNEPLPLPKLTETPFFAVKFVKFFSDGGLSGQTAALSRPYLSSKNEDKSAIENKGILRLKEKQFYELSKKAAKEGWGIATHAIGDAAIGFVLKIYKRLRKEFPEMVLRIEHLGLPTKSHLRTIKKYKIGIATQPIFLEELGDNFIKYIDKEFLNHCYPYKSLEKMGIAVAFSSDAPVVKDFNPLQCIKSAVTRATAKGKIIAAEEAVSVAYGLQAFTSGSALLNGDEHFLGQLKVGFAADFVVLDRNPLETAIENLTEIKVVSTWIGGEKS